MPRVFLITGTSTGFGNHLVQEVLDKGDIAIATARDPSLLKFHGTTDSNFLALALDVTNKASIEVAFKSTLDRFGRVDVVVNNAGYGLAGNFEELTEEQYRGQMEVNFFGLLDVTRKAMQVMREQRPSGGLIQQVTSIGGQRGVPFFSLYCASKWAVEGFTEAVSLEVKPEWGIKFTCIEPGGFRYVSLEGRRVGVWYLLTMKWFRTDWAGRSMTFADRHPAYDHSNAKESMSKRHGTQAGDPKKAAKVMYEFAVMKDPPLRVVVGTDAYAAIMAKLKKYDENYKKYEKMSNSTDVDEK